MNKKFIVNIDNASLESFIDDLTDITSIRIASPYISQYGVECLQRLSSRERIPRENFTIYTGKYFSTRTPSGILASLSNFSDARIVYYNKNQIFHAKVCQAFKRDGSCICFIGSSNYTTGGLRTNLELNYILNPDEDEADQLKVFFMSLEYSSTIIDEGIISNYRKIENQLLELESLGDSAVKLINSVSSADDPFDEKKYSLDEQYFNFRDYESLFPRNAIERHVNGRNALQLKLLDINERIYTTIKKLGIYHHWSEKHITSLAFPCVYNHHYAGWMGVRYGKSKAEIDAMNAGTDNGEDYDFYGFQKHGCIQYSLYKDCFSISIFHAVPHGAVDRYYLHEAIRKSDFRSKLITELAKFEGSDYHWLIDDIEFNMKENRALDFPKFYSDNDGEGSYILFRRVFLPDDRLISKERIYTTIVDEVRKLVPLYNILVYRPV